MLALLDQTEPVVADEAEAAIAKDAAEKLQAVAKTKQDIQIYVRGRPNVIVPLPARAVELFLEVLEAMANRAPLSIIPHEAELTTQQAADYLNVSRPFLTRLIDQGQVSARMVGTHRRIRFSDLLDYERASREKRDKAIADITKEAQRLNLD